MPTKERLSVPRLVGGVTERTFYPALLDVIRAAGGTGVQEVEYNSVPDVQFELLGRTWLLSVKIGESVGQVKSAFLQYLRHKEESKIQDGLLLMLPESCRSIVPREDAVRTAIRVKPVTVLIDAGTVKQELRDRTFPEVLQLLRTEIAPQIERGIASYYSLELVINLLREQVTEVMRELTLQERQILKIVTSWKLLSGLSRLEPSDAKEASKFLAAYVVLSQVLFLRLFSSVRPDIVSDIKPVSRSRMRVAFGRVLEINYRPIFELDVLDLVPERYLEDTFTLIWGMEIEKVRYELPGRIFHELMPSDIRKLLAAFYTRPQAAELLATLTVPTANATVLDPAAGSGTILTAAYRAKLGLHFAGGGQNNPHREYCEHQIFGADIMPFAVHLTCANLAAMEVAETVERTQVMMADSLNLVPGKAYRGGFQQFGLFDRPGSARKRSGEEYDLVIGPGSIDAVLMNPPFTKVERGIREFVQMERFRPSAGGEVGLWGHFIFLADIFLKKDGIYGAVLPINILRGRESALVRRFIFSEWTPKYILKCTHNYGFSEWAEYRDILLVAKKRKSRATDRVKFALVKKNLTELTSTDVEQIRAKLQDETRLRSDTLDIDSYDIQEISERFPNMMWFCSTSDLSNRDAIIRLCESATAKLERYPATYFREGYRPVPKGVSKFLFLTRATAPCRVEEAFLRFEQDGFSHVKAATELGAVYSIAKTDLVASLRTPVGLTRMDISGLHDYLAKAPYSELTQVKRACGYRTRIPNRFWRELEDELKATETQVVVSRRINPYSPNTHLTAFTSNEILSPSNQVNVVLERDQSLARAFCIVVNSWVFWAQFFLLKEESTGRFVDIRFYDLAEMNLRPTGSQVSKLNTLFERYRRKQFPALRAQLDQHFDDRYRQFWESQKQLPQKHLWPVSERPISPSELRLNFDMDVSEALEIKLTKKDLTELYSAIVAEMIITRRLSPD